MSFELFALNTTLQHALNKTGYQTAFAVQTALLPHYAKGSDLFINAPSGAGKTTACLIAALQHLLENQHPDGSGPRLVVMTSGREQAHHVIRTFREITRHIPHAPRIALCPNPYRVENDENDLPLPSALIAPVLVATPENLIDCIKEDKINLSGTRTVIYKNADQLLDAGYWHELERIHRALPPRHQSIFLATHSYEGDLAEVSRLFQKSPFTYSEAHTQPKPPYSERIHLADDLAHKKALLDFIVRDGEVSTALVLTQTTACATRLARFLQQMDLPSTLLTPQGSRVFDVALTAQQKKYVPAIFIGTHASARIAQPRASHVINFNFPSCTDDYSARFAYLDAKQDYPVFISLVSKLDQKKLLLLENSRDKPLLRGLIPGLEPKSGHKPRRGRFGHTPKEQAQQATGDKANEYSGFMRSNTRRGHHSQTPPKSAPVPKKIEYKAQDKTEHAKQSFKKRPVSSTPQLSTGLRTRDDTAARYSAHSSQHHHDDSWESNQKHKNEPLIKVQKKVAPSTEQTPSPVEKIKASRIMGRLGLTKK